MYIRRRRRRRIPKCTSSRRCTPSGSNDSPVNAGCASGGSAKPRCTSLPPPTNKSPANAGCTSAAARTPTSRAAGTPRRVTITSAPLGHRVQQLSHPHPHVPAFHLHAPQRQRPALRPPEFRPPFRRLGPRRPQHHPDDPPRPCAPRLRLLHAGPLPRRAEQVAQGQQQRSDRRRPLNEFRHRRRQRLDHR